MDPKIQQALELIEAGQRSMLEAAETPSCVDGFADEWSATCDMYEKIKKHWYRIDNRRTKLRARSKRNAARQHAGHA